MLHFLVGQHQKIMLHCLVGQHYMMMLHNRQCAQSLIFLNHLKQLHLFLSLLNRIIWDVNQISMMRMFSPKSILCSFLISGNSFFFGGILSGVTHVFELKRVEQSSMSGDRRAICCICYTKIRVNENSPNYPNGMVNCHYHG